MNYTPNTWTNGDVITAAKLNNIEQGIQEVGYDAEIKITYPTSGAAIYTIINGSYAKLDSLIRNNIPPNILVRFFREEFFQGSCSNIVELNYWRPGLSVPDMIFHCKMIDPQQSGLQDFWFYWDANDEVGFWD